MVYDQLILATDFILAKRYEDARHLLSTIDHPKAREWLARLDDFDGNPAAATLQMPRSPALAPPPAPPPASLPPVNNYPFPEQSVPTQATYTPDLAEIFPLNVPDSPPSSGSFSFPLALLGGVIGAIIGAVLWAIVVLVTDYETGIVAILVGALAGAGAMILSGRRGGRSVQVAAVLTALIGIVLGKYLSIYLLFAGNLSEILAGGHSLSTMFQTLPPFAPGTISQVSDIISSSYGLLDLIFLAVAAFAAWTIAGRRAAH